MIVDIVYVLCALTSAVCAFLLFRAYSAARTRLLFWSACCFIGLTVNNILLFLDIAILPNFDLSIWRSLSAVIAVSLLLYGLIWDVE